MPRQENTLDREEWLIAWLDEMPLASAEDLVPCGPYSISQVRKSLTRMEAEGVVRGYRMTAILGLQKTYVLTTAGVDRFRGLYHRDPSWYNCEKGVGTLASRLPMVEQFYRTIPKLVGADRVLVGQDLRPGHIPRMTRFRWLRSSAWHAIIEFERDYWFILVWVGLWSSLKTLRDKWMDHRRGLTMVPSDRFTASHDDQVAQPSAWVIVAQDLWAAQLGIEEVAPYASEVEKLVFVDGRELSLDYGLVPTEDQVIEELDPRDTGSAESTVDRLERDAAMIAVNGKGRYAIFDVVSEYRGATAAQVRRYLGDALDDDVGAVLREQIDAGLVVQFDRNHYLAPTGSTRAANIDRRCADAVKGSTEAFIGPADGTRNRYRVHDGRVMEIAIRFRDQGFPCANGWRGTLHVDGMRTVTPDLMVLVDVGPFGHNRYYLEYERSAKTPEAIENKLRTYRDFAGKGALLPLIVVCDQDDLAKLFLAIGKNSGSISSRRPIPTSRRVPWGGPPRCSRATKGRCRCTRLLTRTDCSSGRRVIAATPSWGGGRPTAGRSGNWNGPLGWTWLSQDCRRHCKA